jgi:membrane protein required for colicin V production
VFGLARGVFLVCLAYLLLDMSVQPGDRPPWLREAKSTPYLHEGADLLRGLLPEALRVRSPDDAATAPDPASEAERARRALTDPAPPQTATPETAPAPNYRPGTQRELDRLIETQR